MAKKVNFVEKLKKERNKHHFKRSFTEGAGTALGQVTVGLALGAAATVAMTAIAVPLAMVSGKETSEILENFTN